MCQNFPLGGILGGGVQGPLMQIWDPPYYLGTTGARKLKLKTQLDVVKYSSWRPGGAGPPNVNLEPPDISETTRARKLNLKIPIDLVTIRSGISLLLNSFNNLYIV